MKVIIIVPACSPLEPNEANVLLYFSCCRKCLSIVAIQKQIPFLPYFSVFCSYSCFVMSNILTCSSPWTLGPGSGAPLLMPESKVPHFWHTCSLSDLVISLICELKKIDLEGVSMPLWSAPQNHIYVPFLQNGRLYPEDTGPETWVCCHTSTRRFLWVSVPGVEDLSHVNPWRHTPCTWYACKEFQQCFLPTASFIMCLTLSSQWQVLSRGVANIFYACRQQKNWHSFGNASSKLLPPFKIPLEH